MINSILLLIIFLFALIFIHSTNEKRSRDEKDRFREFVRAIKSKTMEEYNMSTPEESNFELEEEDELVELNEVEPNTLLKAIKRKDENN